MIKSIELKKMMRGLGFSDAFSFEYFRRRQIKLKMLFNIEMTTVPLTAVLESFAFAFAFWCVRKFSTIKKSAHLNFMLSN